MACFNFDETIETIASVSDVEPNVVPSTASEPKKKCTKQTTIQFSKAVDRDRCHLGNVSARQRAADAEFSGQLYEDGGLLFCKICNLVIDHTRRSSIQNHIKSAKHLKRQEDAAITSDTKKQKTVTTSFKQATIAQVERVQVLCIQNNNYFVLTELSQAAFHFH